MRLRYSPDGAVPMGLRWGCIGAAIGAVIGAASRPAPPPSALDLNFLKVKPLLYPSSGRLVWSNSLALNFTMHVPRWQEQLPPRGRILLDREDHEMPQGFLDDAADDAEQLWFSMIWYWWKDPATYDVFLEP